MQRYAISFRIKPGTENEVRELLANYDPPEWVTPEGTRLVDTSIFLQGDLVVRVMTIDGELSSVMAHLARQPGIQELERRLDPYLAESRDMSTPTAARDFFRRALMEHVTTRRAVDAA